MIMLGNRRTGRAAPMYWRSGVIRKVCVSPKAAETRALLRLMDDGVHMAKQLSQLLNVKMKVRLFTDLHPLLESIGSSGQIEEKALRQSVAYLKQSLEDEEVMAYSWIQGEEIVADILTKQGSKHKVLDRILINNEFNHTNTEDNKAPYKGDELKLGKRVTKKDEEVEKKDES